MGKHIGRLEEIIVDTQQTRGVPATTPKFTIPYTNADFQNKPEKEMDTGATGNIAINQASVLTKFSGAGTIDFIPDIYTMIPFLSASTGTNYKDLPLGTDNLDGTYTHTFNVAENGEHCALSIFAKDENLGTLLYDLAMINSMKLDTNAGALSGLSVDLISKQSEDTTPVTKTCNAGRVHFKGSNTSLNLGDTLATLGSNVEIKSMSMNVMKNAEADYFCGSISPEDINNKGFEVDIDLELSYKNREYFDLFVNNTERAAEIKVDIGSNKGVSFKFPNINFESYSKTISNDDIVTQKITAKMVVNCEADYFYAELTNDIEDLSTI